MPYRPAPPQPRLVITPLQDNLGQESIQAFESAARVALESVWRGRRDADPKLGVAYSSCGARRLRYIEPRPNPWAGAPIGTSTARYRGWCSEENLRLKLLWEQEFIRKMLDGLFSRISAIPNPLRLQGYYEK